MKKKHLSSIMKGLAVSTMVILPGISSAVDFGDIDFGDITVQPRVNTGIMHYEFEQDALITQSGGIGDFALSSTMPFIDFGASVFADNGVFVDFYYRKAFSGEDSADQKILIGTDQTPSAFTVESIRFNSEWDRDEFSFTAGYTLTENFAVYAGYTRSEVDFENTVVGASQNNPISQGTVFRNNYIQDGPFIGGRYGWYISKPEWSKLFEGILSFNLALAFLSGENEGLNEIVLSDGTRTSNQNTNVGDTVGLSLGAKWTGNVLKGSLGGGLFPKGINYNLGIDGYQYNFDSDKENSASFSESVIRFSVGLSAPFQI